jgi:GNAT superfamily N-acetyltransferase
MIRPYEERDAERIVAIGARVYPEAPPNLPRFLYRDRKWNPEYLKLRLVVERDGQVVGWGQVTHIWWAYHARRFSLRLEIDPTAQHTGLGSALYEPLLAQLEEWGAELVRTDTLASRSDAVRWLERHGYSEIMRERVSTLQIADVDAARASEAERELAAQGIRITTLTAERERRGEDLLEELYELEVAGAEGEPRPEGDSLMSFERFVSEELGAPGALHEANYLAYDGPRLTGLTRLERDLARPWALIQGFTTVRPWYRGRGIATGLKAFTVRYAAQNGYRQIDTRNDLTNAPMLRINEALGFREQAQMVIYEHRFD